jgi:hypothetical protein
MPNSINIGIIIIPHPIPKNPDIKPPNNPVAKINTGSKNKLAI